MGHHSADQAHDPLHPHRHDPNPEPPTDDPTFIFIDPDLKETLITVDALEQMPRTVLPDCYIVSTGHGTSGPFSFGGVRLIDFVEYQLAQNRSWSQVEVISTDGFGNRVTAAELNRPVPADRPIILSYLLDGQKMTRAQGLVRMVVPSETDDALRQVKWVGRIVVRV